MTPLLVQTLFDLADAKGVGKIALASIDDSLTIKDKAKDKATRHLHAVDWHHDHLESKSHRTGQSMSAPGGGLYLHGGHEALHESQDHTKA